MVQKLLGAVWLPTIVIWFVGIISLGIMFFVSSRVVYLIDEQTPIVSVLRDVNDRISLMQLNNSYLQSSDNVGDIQSNINADVHRAISLLSDLQLTEYVIQDKILNLQLDSLKNYLIRISSNNLSNIKSPSKAEYLLQNENKVLEAKEFSTKILQDVINKQSEVFSQFKYLRGLIMFIIASVFFGMGILIYNYNKIKKSDIKKIKESIKSVNEQKSYLESLIQSTPAAIVVLDENDIVKKINHKFTALFGYTEQEIIGNKLASFIVPSEYEEEAKNLFNKSKLDEGVILRETQRKRKDGKIIDVVVIGSPIINQGKFEGIYGIYQDISEQKEHEEELLKAKEVAENADKLKSVFLAQMSHEIRTPINSMISLAQLINLDLREELSEDHQLCLNLIDKSGNRIVRTVDLLLNLSELQAGTYQPIYTNLDIYDNVISELELKYKMTALEKDTEISVQFLTNDKVIYADSYTVSQIFEQLINNAIKYTDKGKVTIKISRNSFSQLVVEVIDSGIGISTEYLANLFEPFSQEEMGYSRKFDGNGIGLALVKNYCDLNRAHIDVESEKNVGSNFKVTFTN